MNQAPLPQPSARTCPNCGAAVDENAALCPNCGMALAAAPNGCLIVGAQVFLSLLALIFGFGGACLVIIGGVSVPDIGMSPAKGIAQWAPFIGGGLVAGGLAAACIWGIIQLGKRRK